MIHEKILIRFKEGSSEETMKSGVRSLGALPHVTNVHAKVPMDPTPMQALYYYATVPEDRIDETISAISGDDRIDMVCRLFEMLTLVVPAGSQPEDELRADMVQKLSRLAGVFNVHSVPHMVAMDRLNQATFNLYAKQGSDIRDIRAQVVKMVGSERVGIAQVGGLVHL